MTAPEGTAAEERHKPAWIRVIRQVGRFTAILGSIVSGAIMLGIVVDVARRQLTGRSIPGMIELIETFMVVVVFLGLAHAEAAGVHVRMSLVVRALPFGARRVVRSFGMTVCMAASAWFSWAAAQRAITSTASGEVRPGLLRFPVWPARIVIAVGFAVLVLEYAARVWEEWHARPETEGGVALPEASDGAALPKVGESLAVEQAQRGDDR